MIKNTTKNTILVDSYKNCQSMLSKGIGLMFRIKPQGLLFAFKEDVNVPLHMFFVFFPIDVLWLSAEMKVLHKLENFKPFSYYNPKIPSRYVIELPLGVAKKTKIGDKIQISN